MKKFFLLMTAALMAMSVSAAPVDQATALQKAKSFLSNQLYAGKLMAPAALNPVLLKAEVGNAKLGQPVFYIYNTSSTFIVVAGDDRAEEILMVGDRPLKDINNLAPGLKDMLGQYKNEIMFLQEHPGLKVDPIAAPRTANKLSGSDSGGTYMLDCMWDQETPYNNLCKFTYSGTTYTCYTGCPATSASMVMYYWKWPTAATGEVPAYTSTLDISSSRSVNFTYAALASTTFDWDNMIDSYSGSYTTAQGNAVATLMRYVGQAEEMMYGTSSAGGSGISVYNAQDVADMFIRFGYDESTTRLVQKTSDYSGGQTLYSDSEWATLIQTEMNAGRPVVFMAVSSSAGGHAFNVDGYNSSTNKYHCNFGWSGDGNAWCSLNSFGYSSGWSSYYFNSFQQMIIGIQPADLDPVLTVSPSSLTFTGYTGNTYTQTFTVTGKYLTGNVTLSCSGTGYSISPTTLTAAQAEAGATVTVTYAPTATGTRTGTVTVASSGATSQTVSLTGTATERPVITPSETAMTFTTNLGTAVTKTFTVKGSNLAGNVTLSCSGTGFSINKTTISATAASTTSGSSVTVTYNPTTEGTHTGTITLTSEGAETKTITLNGTAVDNTPVIRVNPASLTFTNLVGETATQTFTVTGANLTGDLSLSLNDENGVFNLNLWSVTATQAANGVTVTATYAPTTFGTHNATVTVSGGGATPVTIALAGQADLIRYAPVMLEANDTYVGLTQFRADWTDETPEENVSSYTLEVSQKGLEEAEEVATADFTSFAASGQQSTPVSNLDTYCSPTGWTGTVYPGQGGVKLGYSSSNVVGTLTTAPLDFTKSGGKLTITFSANTYVGGGGGGNSTAASLVIATGEHSYTQTLTTTATTYTIVLDCDALEGQTVSFTSANNRVMLRTISITTTDVTAASLMASESGDATYRLITGITPDTKFYVVTGLTAEGTFEYKVKALYVDGTESDWSNIEVVTLHENAHPYAKGDVNHSGKVDVADVQLVIERILGKGTTEICELCADVNGDGNIDVADVSGIIDIVLGKASSASLTAIKPLFMKR